MGAGFAGIYALHKLRGQGLSVRVFEAAPEVGGTWYYNRYPGARCDVESVDYCYSFSDELAAAVELDREVRDAGRDPALPELGRRQARPARRNHVQHPRRLGGVRRGDASHWTVTTDTGEYVAARFCVMATGPLSAALTPDFHGLDTFAGEVYHTAHWPHEPVDFTGKRVAVIGTGSSGIQSIPIIAEQADALYVFQRTPNYSVPAGNRAADRRRPRRHQGGLRRATPAVVAQRRRVAAHRASEADDGGHRRRSAGQRSKSVGSSAACCSPRLSPTR